MKHKRIICVLLTLMLAFTTPAIAANQTIVIDYGVTITGNVHGNGSFPNGTGTLTLTGSNTYSGDTTISGGILNLTGGLGSGGMIAGRFSIHWYKPQ